MTIYHVDTSPGGAINYTVNAFSASGTWTKPSDFDYAIVVMIGAGSGGGGGRRGAAGVIRAGGFAGRVGLMSVSKFTDSQLSVTESVTVGTGGTGGAGASVDDTNGTAGGASTATNFKYGSTYQISGNSGGNAGTNAFSNGLSYSVTTNFTAAPHTVMFTTFGPTILGCQTPNHTTPNDSHRGNAHHFGAGGKITVSAGTPGGGITAADVQTKGGSLIGYYDFNGTLHDEATFINPGDGPLSPTGSYTVGAWLENYFPWFDALDADYRVGRSGCGGSCGDAGGTVTGSNASVGIGYGAAGGGGGASTNGVNAGSGSAGMGGLVVIINVLTT